MAHFGSSNHWRGERFRRSVTVAIVLVLSAFLPPSLLSCGNEIVPGESEGEVEVVEEHAPRSVVDILSSLPFDEPSFRHKSRRLKVMGELGAVLRSVDALEELCFLASGESGLAPAAAAMIFVAYGRSGADQLYRWLVSSERSTFRGHAGMAAWLVFLSAEDGAESLDMGIDLFRNSDAGLSAVGHYVLAFSTLQATYPGPRSVGVGQYKLHSKVDWEPLIAAGWKARDVMARAMDSRLDWIEVGSMNSKGGRNEILDGIYRVVSAWRHPLASLLYQVEREKIGPFVSRLPAIHEVKAFRLLQDAFDITSIVPSM